MNARERFDRWVIGCEPPGFLLDAGQYVEDALKEDLVYAEETLGSEECALVHRLRGHGTLLVLVGSTPGPVVLSVELMRPKQVVLAGSNTRDGKKYVNEVINVLGRRPDAPGVDAPTVKTCFFRDDNPASAYQELADALADAPRPWVMDITGGRKSMSATAFFLAADQGVECVHFAGEYEPKVGHPKPATGRLRMLPNPEPVLALASERRARDYWERHDFRLAGEVLRGMVAQAGDWVASDRREAWERAARMTDGLRAWENAAYASLAPEMGVVLPPFVDDLRRRWPRKDASRQAIDDELTRTPDLLIAYLVDQWCWTNARLSVNPRMRYQRFYSLLEFLTDATYSCLRERGAILGHPSGDAEGRLSAAVRAKLVWCGDATLQRDDAPPRALSVDARHPAPPAGVPNEAWNSKARDLRNGCAHAYSTVTENDVARIREVVRALLPIGAQRLSEQFGPGPNASTVEGWLSSWTLPRFDDLVRRRL